MSWHPASQGKCSDYFENNNTVMYSRRNYNPQAYNRDYYKALNLRSAMFGDLTGNVAVAKTYCLKK